MGRDGMMDSAAWAVRVLAAAAAAVWGGLTPMVQVLIALMALDIMTGVLAAYATRSISSDVSFRGMARKGIVLVVVGAAAVVQKPTGLPLADAVAGFYIAHEGISLLENTARAGLPVPAVLEAALEKLSPETPEASNRPDRTERHS